LHQLLGEYLAGLYLGGCLGSTKDRNTYLLKVVNNAISERCLWPDNDQFNTLLPGYSSQRLYITRTNIQVTGNLSRAGIAWGDINLLNFGALG